MTETCTSVNLLNNITHITDPWISVKLYDIVTKSSKLVLFIFPFIEVAFIFIQQVTEPYGRIDDNYKIIDHVTIKQNRQFKKRFYTVCS